MLYHATLQKQIEKFLDEKLVDSEAIKGFLESVNSTYFTFERDRKLTDHAFNMSEVEYQKANNELQEEIELRKESITKLKEVIKSLDPNSAFFVNDKTDDGLINTISYLERQIQKTKQLETDLITSKETAERAFQAKSDFLSVMSHEIRTPLNAIIGTILLLKTRDPLPSQQELLRVLEISSENLLSLINDVLDFNKLEEGKIRFSERDIELIHFLRNIKMAYRIKAEERGNQIKIIYDEDIPDFIKGDDIRLGQIINNLVSNAIKFTKNGTVIMRVSLEENNENDVLVYFSVEDTGIGISKEKQELIFERFTQANAHITRDFGGSGLGLTIIKKLLQLQKSDIYLDSEFGVGSKFYFRLRFKKSKTTIREEKVQIFDKQDLFGIHVLLVEDVTFNVMVAEGMLQNWNAIIDVAENGKVAVEKMKDAKYDIVLMDIQMPVMDGYTATSEIRRFDTKTPIIALTASISIDIQEKAANSGMNGFITKPFNPNDLFAAIYQNTIGKDSGRGSNI
jgi:signal transduction histidine kinase/CheY-like chemotaxis protein